MWLLVEACSLVCGAILFHILRFFQGNALGTSRVMPEVSVCIKEVARGTHPVFRATPREIHSASRRKGTYPLYY